MKRSQRRISKRLGLSPGSVLRIGMGRTGPARIEVTNYTKSEHLSRSCLSPHELISYKHSLSREVIGWLFCFFRRMSRL
jgi:hypothetical protein